MYDRLPEYTDEDLESYIDRDKLSFGINGAFYRSDPDDQFVGVTVMVDGLYTRMCERLQDGILFEYIRRKGYNLTSAENGIAKWEKV